MGKVYLALILLSISVVSSNGEEAAAAANIPFPNEKETKLHFYMHEIINGPNATSTIVAQGPSTFQSPTYFGLVTVLDNILRTEPNNNSEILGRLQGLTAFSSLAEFSLHMTVDLVFTSGEYNGSSLSVMGHNPYLHEARELPVVGGSGAFQFARGVFVVRTVSFDSPPGVNFFEINVTVLHRAAHGPGGLIGS